MSSSRNFYRHLPSPIGKLLLTSDGTALTGLYMEPHTIEPGWQRDDALLQPVADQLAAYFAGERRDFDFPLTLAGTPFQRRVWAALRAIPFGATISYGELARRIGSPTASRAVGAANGRNPI